MTPSAAFWRGRRVFLTGHTGFKGAWLSLWLARLGAEVHGYALEPPTQPSLFALAGVAEVLTSHRIADIRDLDRLKAAVAAARPDIVIHMAAQPLVRESYVDPVGTYATNVMGTVNLFEGVRSVDSVRAVVIVTTDKCYENRGWTWGYREIDPLGGYDPYSNSKACSELVTAAYRSSFFNPAAYDQHGVAIGSGRAGNVIGGGDWAKDRLIPDLVQAFALGNTPLIRSPHAVRPWQHVMEPLSGYLLLCQKLYEDGTAGGEGWNFGPRQEDARPVSWIADRLAALWGENAAWQLDAAPQPHEASYLYLDTAKAGARLGYQPRWRLDDALTTIVDWYRAHRDGADIRAVTLGQIAQFEEAADIASDTPRHRPRPGL
ncbi:CDP-glucose 4,6-dehydratase [Aliidongia dinghuensis]|uniref:CDP-glucose 4,6-dehydratase n=1 Tax=Aliidongia dinghuensis TaxID=1867774 RepID=A0A8J2YVE6_9PROT|nr:CDP-glucose 4,6-dehydratase [Aliidongia dinghuensis]GGF27435.1 CDP-glucose 4,6-dehydratase [Aliidongia dinghuensis]